jgi:hypothetical protein
MSPSDHSSESRPLVDFDGRVVPWDAHPKGNAKSVALRKLTGGGTKLVTAISLG